jgi:hypothetical protein
MYVVMGKVGGMGIVLVYGIGSWASIGRILGMIV